jgi:hypothetical protein
VRLQFIGLPELFVENIPAVSNVAWVDGTKRLSNQAPVTGAILNSQRLLATIIRHSVEIGRRPKPGFLGYVSRPIAVVDFNDR